jgi:regulator of protease activity HflC (stomatin/prohibitin superfamily)
VNLVQMEVRTRNYTMSSQHDEGQRRGDDSIAVITSDGLTVNLDVTVLYAMELAKLPEIYRTLGENVEERLVRSEIRSAIRDAAASLAATDLYSAKRQEFVAWVTKTLTERFTARGIALEQVLLRDVRLPQQITQAINAKIAADQEAQKMTFVLQKEKQEAERKRIEAEGQAKAQEIVSRSLTPQILDYQRIQALKDIGAHGNMVITGTGGTPLIQVAPKRGE